MKFVARIIFLASLVSATLSGAEDVTVSKMKGIVGATRTIVVGEETFVDSISFAHPFAVVFEDDGETGYFYAIDRTDGASRILDAAHIYNGADVTDGHIPSKLVILWSNDGLKSALLINEYPHAVFDFAARRSYCRTNFPPPNETWPQPGREWSESVLELFQ